MFEEVTLLLCDISDICLEPPQQVLMWESSPMCGLSHDAVYFDAFSVVEADVSVKLYS